MIPWPIPLPQPVHPGPLGGSVQLEPSPMPDWLGGPTSQIGSATTTVGVVNVPSAPVSGPTSAQPEQTPGGHPFKFHEFAVWIAALALLWFILTALKEAGYPDFANGIAGLIMFGALLYLGHDAILNARQLAGYLPK